MTSGTSAAARLRLGLWLLWAGGVLAYYFAYVPRALFSRDVTLSFDVRGAAVHEQVDDALRLGREVRLALGEGMPREVIRGGQLAGLTQQRRQPHRTEAQTNATQ